MNQPRKAKLLFIAVLVSFIYAAPQTTTTKTTTKKTTTTKKVQVASYCSGAQFPLPPAKITSASATIPPDFCGTPSQSNFDLYSWNTFVALNWPANAATCTADTTKSVLSGTGPTVWESYLTDTDIFVPQGQQPSTWCPQANGVLMIGARWNKIPPAALELANKTGIHRFIRQTSKASVEALPNFQGIDQAVGGPLTDQNNRFVRYEIHINADEYAYIMKNKLWSKAGQTAFTPPVAMPSGNLQTNVIGAMEIKSAWKILGNGDNPSHFYTTQAIVFNDNDGNPSPCPNPVTLGLVGLHIIHKTTAQNLWIWSTFEQVENLTTSFYNPSCTTCPANKQTAQTPYTEMKPGCVPNNTPVQLTRVTPIEQQAGPLNIVFKGLLKGSVWQYYQLVGTQWQGNIPPSPTPAVLANTTMESFIQPTSSCISCHKSATLSGQNVSSDMSFALSEAQ